MMKSKLMKAAIIEKFGLPDVLKIKYIHVPEIKKGEILIKVWATSINPLDWKIRRHGFKGSKVNFPLVLGLDIAGEIVAIEKNLTEYKLGDKVYGYIDISRMGGYAEYVIALPNEIAFIPEGMSFNQAASLPVAGITAMMGLFDIVNIEPNQTVLIHGAAGGVGSIAVQLAKYKRARIIGTASAYNYSFLKDLGVTIELKDIDHRVKANNLFYKVSKDLVNDTFIDYDQYYGGLGVKFPRETTLLEAHQDTTMIPYDANRTALTLWTPLMDVGIENGCIHVFPKSHKYNRVPRASGCTFAYKNYMSEVLKMMIPIPIKKGQMIVMDQSIIHFSDSNRSEYVRVAVMGMIKPREDKLVYYNRLDNSCDKLEVFDVPNDFYTFHMLSTRPNNAKLTKVIENKNSPYLWF